MSNYWNLPPGCTPADIDRAMGGNEPHCHFCGKEVEDPEELEGVWDGGRLRPACDHCAYLSEETDEDIDL
jgi:hypothetical protein